MAAKTTELTKLLKKIEKKLCKMMDDPWNVNSLFMDIEEYKEYIRKELKLTKKSTVYVFDMEDENYMTQYYETLMGYVGQDVSIQVNQTFVVTCEGEIDLIVMVVTLN